MIFLLEYVWSKTRSVGTIEAVESHHATAWRRWQRYWRVGKRGTIERKERRQPLSVPRREDSKGA